MCTTNEGTELIESVDVVRKRCGGFRPLARCAKKDPDCIKEKLS